MVQHVKSVSGWFYFEPKTLIVVVSNKCVLFVNTFYWPLHEVCYFYIESNVQSVKDIHLSEKLKEVAPREWCPVAIRAIDILDVCLGNTGNILKMDFCREQTLSLSPGFEKVIELTRSGNILFLLVFFPVNLSHKDIGQVLEIQFVL